MLHVFLLSRREAFRAVTMAASARAEDGEGEPLAAPPVVLMEALALASASGGSTHRSESCCCAPAHRRMC